jgi:DNA invertase Pin-like site-specific DNA recombinase
LQAGVEFLAADNPHANKLTIHILAAVAQHEREMISERTKSALQAAKARGRVLGNPRLSEVGAKGRAVTAASAQRFAENLMPIIREIKAAGTFSNAAIAAKQNGRKIAPNLRAILAAHIPLQFVDERRLWPTDDVQRHGLVGVAAETTDLKVEIFRI